MDLPLRNESILPEKPSSEPASMISFNKSNSNMNSDAASYVLLFSNLSDRMVLLRSLDR